MGKSFGIGKRKIYKKGGLPDIAFWAILLLFFAVVMLVSFKVVAEINTNVQGMDQIPANAKTATTFLEGTYPGIIDNTFLFLAIGIMLVSLILAALVRVHPIFIPIFWIALLLVIFFSGVLSNIYQEMAANPQLIAQADQLTFISNILNILPILVAVAGHILLFVMYKLYRIS